MEHDLKMQGEIRVEQKLTYFLRKHRLSCFSLKFLCTLYTEMREEIINMSVMYKKFGFYFLNSHKTPKAAKKVVEPI